MAGTREGGRAAAETIKLAHGDDFYRRIGSKGGKRGKKDGAIKGFAANPELARRAGAKGGRISRKVEGKP